MSRNSSRRTQYLLRNKIKPFVGKKIADVLGEEVSDMVDFVLEHIRKRGALDALVKEMEGVMEDEAAGFAMVVWRMLCFETECVVRGLV